MHWKKMIAFTFSILLSLTILSCSTSLNQRVEYPFEQRNEITKEVIDYTLYKIKLRNTEIEDTPEWIEKAYSKLHIQNLKHINESDYRRYRRYLDKGRIYIIVHPAFFTFFEYDLELGNPHASTLNYLERFLAETPLFPKLSLIQAQEKVMRDFLEVKSTQRRLIILILPDHYMESDRYYYKFKKDEYTRFLNEVTNESDSVLYLYSKSMNSGRLRGKDMRVLKKFISYLKADAVLVGGSYYGRCVSSFFRQLKKRIDFVPSQIVADLVALSPSDISFSTAVSLVKKDGSLDSKRLTEFLAKNKVNRQRPIPEYIVNIR